MIPRLRRRVFGIHKGDEVVVLEEHCESVARGTVGTVEETSTVISLVYILYPFTDVVGRCHRWSPANPERKGATLVFYNHHLGLLRRAR